MAGNRPNAEIHVVIVESHDEALAHIHMALRRQKRLGTPFSMIHFDSHADLACPGPHVPAYCCFRPSFEVFKGCEDAASATDQDEEQTTGSDLYDLLHSTTSGIAEWILPLVLAANLQRIHWIRPPRKTDDAVLIPNGEHRYRVGAWCDGVAVDSFVDLPIEAQVKVDSTLLYYMEDGSTVPQEELMLSQVVSLQVSEEPIRYPATNGDCDYILDICLDFFCCTNPFLADLELKNQAFAAAFRRVIARANKASSVIQNYHNEDCHHRLRSRRRTLGRTLTFRKALVELLQGVGVQRPSDPELQQTFAPFFDCQAECLRLMRCLVDSLFDGDRDSVPNLVEMAIEAIPYAMMPHDTVPGTKQYPWIDERMRIFEETLQQLEYSPFLITIARSASDGFTSPQVVQEIQNRVVMLIQASRLVGGEGCVVENDWIIDSGDKLGSIM